MQIQDFGTLQMVRSNDAHYGQGQMVSLTSSVENQSVKKINTGIINKEDKKIEEELEIKTTGTHTLNNIYHFSIIVKF